VLDSFRSQRPFLYAGPVWMHGSHLNVLLQACLRTPSRLSRIADESRILNFRRMLEKHKLASGFFCSHQPFREVDGDLVQRRSMVSEL